MNNTDLKSLLFTHDGRINRARYWMAIAIYVAIFLFLAIMSFMIFVSGTMLIVMLLIYLPVAISGIFVGIKRLHDRDKSGWWLALYYALPLILNTISYRIGPEFVLSTASLAVSIWALIDLGVLRGTTGPNRYGPDPLGN